MIRTVDNLFILHEAREKLGLCNAVMILIGNPNSRGLATLQAHILLPFEYLALQLQSQLRPVERR